uniref:Uncharacterized protein n=1 Tax=Physcomitrium patens TaxID=3218 RepID=A0A2K1IZU6_PHYPA|nr:hypothetical protein PHYPA_022703 [Physcomitrium patens]
MKCPKTSRLVDSIGFTSMEFKYASYT